MKKYENGQYIEMTEKEINELDNNIVELIPSLEERIEALEMILLEQILGGKL